MGGRGGRSHRGSGGGGAGNDAVIRNFLTTAYGGRHADAVMALLANAPDHIREMWQDYASAFQAGALPHGEDRAYYSPLHDRVYLNIARVSTGSVIATPYSVLFHEYGHMADFLIGRTTGRIVAYSDVFNGLDASGNALLNSRGKSGLLGRTAKDEVAGHLARMKRIDPHMTDSQAAQSLLYEIRSKYSRKERADLSDMLEGAGIGIAYPLGAGHGLSYWDVQGNSKEIFAEIISAETANPGSLKAIKEYFPRTYGVYLDMMKARKKR